MVTNLTMPNDWPMYIGGTPRKGCGTDVRDPGSGEIIAQVPRASEADVAAALDQAEEGARIGRSLPTHRRMEILRRAANCLEAELEAVARLIARESSKTIREARKEAGRCVDTLRLSAEEARRLGGEVIRFDQARGSDNRMGFWDRGPLGVVTAITPFNDPLNLVAHKVGPAIAMGNAVVLKPSEKTPLSAIKLAELLYEAGLPGPMLSVLTGSAANLGDQLIQDARVRMVTFTGGIQTGRHIAQMVGLKKVSMELGSNSPVIILDDADLNLAARATVSGAFWAAGQNCLGVQRIFIQDSVYEEIKDRIVALTRQLTVGDKLNEATDMGPLINEHEAQRVEAWVEDARRHGARILTGGARHEAYYQPTILEDVPAGAIVLEEEIFGPVASLVPVRDLDEAIFHANDVNYGLQAGVFTGNLNRAFQAIRTLDVGGVMINDSSDYRIDAMPFGGVKGSGLGREGVRFTCEAMSEPKVVCFNLEA